MWSLAITVLAVLLHTALTFPQFDNDNEMLAPPSDPQQGNNNLNGPQQGNNNPNGPQQGNTNSNGPQQGTNNPNGPQQGSNNPNGPQQGNNNPNGPQQGNNNPNGPQQNTNVVSQENIQLANVKPNPPRTTPRVTTPGTTTTAQSPQILVCIQQCPVTSQYSPVCGSNGQTYNNISAFRCAQSCGTNISMTRQGPCAARGRK